MFCYGLLALLEFCHCLFFCLLLMLLWLFLQILNFSELLCSTIIWKLKNVFVEIVNYICLNLFPLSPRQAVWYDWVSVLTQRRSGLKIEKKVFVWLPNCICLDLFWYFSTAGCVSALTWKQLTQRRSGCFLWLPASQTTSTWPSCKLYLSKVDNVFVNIALSICQHCSKYLSKSQVIFVWIVQLAPKLRLPVPSTLLV